MYELRVVVHEDRIRRRQSKLAETRPALKRYANKDPAAEELDEFAANVDELVGLMSQAVDHVDMTCELVDQLADRIQTGQPAVLDARCRATRSFRPAEDVEYSPSGCAAWIPAIVRAAHVEQDTDAEFELSITAGQDEVRKLAVENRTWLDPMSAMKVNEARMHNFNILLEGSHALEGNLRDCVQRFKGVADACGGAVSGVPTPPASHSSTSMVEAEHVKDPKRPTSRPALRPSSAKHWAIRHGQFGLTRTAWHGPSQLGPMARKEEPKKRTENTFWQTDGRHLWN
jgi:hypothetical protein